MNWTTTTDTDFKIGDKVKLVSFNNTFKFSNVNHLVDLLNKTFTVCDIFDVTNIQLKTIDSYVTVKENSFYWNVKDLILITNKLEIE